MLDRGFFVIDILVFKSTYILRFVSQSYLVKFNRLQEVDRMKLNKEKLNQASKEELLSFASSLIERNERISFALESTQAGIWQWDTNESKIFLSSESFKMLGFNYSDGKIPYDQLMSRLHPSDVKIMSEVVEDHVRAYPDSLEIEFRVVKKPGEYMWLRSNGKLKNKPVKGRKTVIIGTIDNINWRKELELELIKNKENLEHSIKQRTQEIAHQNKLLHDRERAYSTLLKNLQGMAYRYDNDGKWTMLFVSDGCLELTGYDPEDLLNGTIKMEEQILLKDFVDPVWNHITKALDKKESFKISYPIITKDLELKWVLDRGVGVYDKKGKLIFLEGVVIDITDQKNQELKYQLAQKTIDNAPIAIQWIKEDGSYYYVNETALEYSGYSKKEFSNVKIFDIDPLLNEDSWKWLFKERLTKSAHDIETSFIRKDGTSLPVLVNASNIEFEGVVYNCSYINDISNLKEAENKLKEAYDEIATSEKELRQRTEELNTLNDSLFDQKSELEKVIVKLREAQDQLVQAEKMASLGVLVAGIAHELNNPINYLSTGGESLKIIIEDVLAVVNLYKDIDKSNINEKLEEISRLKQELSFDELLDDLTKMTNNINVGAEQATDIIRGLKSFSRMDSGTLSKYDIHQSIDNVLLMLHNTYKYRIKLIKNYSEIPEIQCYPAKLSQVFMNLINNSIQAIEGEGEVEISTYLKGDNAVIDIKDSGPGVPVHIVSRVFEPFFTTKDTGRGTGLGLSISMGIVEDHNGQIEFFNNDEKGATFRVSIPLKQS